MKFRLIYSVEAKLLSEFLIAAHPFGGQPLLCEMETKSIHSLRSVHKAIRQSPVKRYHHPDGGSSIINFLNYLNGQAKDGEFTFSRAAVRKWYTDNGYADNTHNAALSRMVKEKMFKTISTPNGTRYVYKGSSK